MEVIGSAAGIARRGRTRLGTLGPAILLALVACGQAQPAPSAARSTPSPAAPPTALATAPPTPTPSPTLPAVPDFSVVAYQGDQAFGGHQGHFAAAFAAGRPVVLLYYAGL
jgi:hypothetical protein